MLYFFKAFCEFNKGELICVKFFKNILVGNFFWVGYFVPTQDGRQQSPALYLNKVVSHDESATANSVVDWHYIGDEPINNESTDMVSIGFSCY